jgi:hypothetical protein
MWERTAAENTKKVDKKALCRKCGNELPLKILKKLTKKLHAGNVGTNCRSKY